MSRWLLLVGATLATSLLAGVTAAAAELTVTNPRELRAALRELTDGSTLRIAPGEYPGGNSVRNVQRLTITATDPNKKPVFRGGNVGWHFSQCSDLRLHALQVRGQSQNGINVDDGGDAARPAQRIVIQDVVIQEIGPRGNCDGLKCSGVDDLKIADCHLEGWAGQGIDLVGCHQVEIRKCVFQGRDGYEPSSGVQAKGGSAEVLIADCRFLNAGQRAINMGGSTGAAYFRPLGAPYEARQIRATGNYIDGSLCACAFVGVEGAEFRKNVVQSPEKWVFRILQENTAEGMVPCQQLQISENWIIFTRRKVAVEVNIGPHTRPETATFDANIWFAEDQPERSRPKLPTTETRGKYGSDPRGSTGP